ncbi:hypothetical protein [Anaerosporobacter sp.]
MITITYTYNTYARRSAKGINPEITSSITIEEEMLHIKIKKDGVLLSGKKLRDGTFRRDEIKSINKKSCMIMSFTDLINLIGFALLLIISIIFYIVEPIPLPLVSIVLLVVYLILLRFSSIVVKLKNGDTYCIPYSASIFTEQCDKQEITEIINAILR